jgi:hypothetical protein
VPVWPSPLQRRASAIAAVVAACAVLSAGSGPSWTLAQDGRIYVYTVTVTSPLRADALLDVLFDPTHVAAFSKSAGRLVVLSEADLANEVRFDTRRLIFKCSTTFKRTLNRESGLIDIEMTGFSAGWGRLAPQAQSSRARYTVTDHGAYRQVVYRQDVQTDRPVSGYSLHVLRKSMQDFARDLEQYLQRPELAGASRRSSRAVR